MINGQTQFTGPLPKAVSKLKRLMILEANGNDLDGDLPAFPLGLVKLHLQNNEFVHDLPPSLFLLRGLADVNLSDNCLSGAVSDDVANLTALRLFKMEGNRHSATDRAVITDSLTAYLPALVKAQGFRI